VVHFHRYRLTTQCPPRYSSALRYVGPGQSAGGTVPASWFSSSGCFDLNGQLLDQMSGWLPGTLCVFVTRSLSQMKRLKGQFRALKRQLLSTRLRKSKQDSSAPKRKRKSVCREKYLSDNPTNQAGLFL